ncbi:similar to An01g06160 [Aspergillus luchuensis IFO 4308]|nr:similar to An01g06160 [Aspergillus luchuensis IFO 4308]
MASLLVDASQEESQWACISELASQLASVLTLGGDTENSFLVSKPYYTCLLRDPRLYTFSEQLIQALLHHVLKVDNCKIHQLLSILKRHSKRILQGLDRSSLRCLAYFLLNSDEETRLKNGLYLLLDEPQYIKDSGHMAGKMFLEILSEPEHNHASFITSQEVDMSRLSYIILNGNCALKLIATTMIHALHNLGVSDEVLWPPDNSTDRVRFFDTMPSYKDDPLQHFQILFDTVVLSDAAMPSKSIDLSTTSQFRRCFLLHAIGIDTTLLIEGIVLAMIDDGCLTFMSYRQDTARMCLEYVDVYTQSICLPARSVTDKTKTYRLIIDLSQHRLIVKSGKRLCFGGQTLSILSDEDPCDLRMAIEEFCRNDRTSVDTDSVFRRSSSMVLELDTGDEVARKSSGIPPNNIQEQEGPCTGFVSIQKARQVLEKHPEVLEEGNTNDENLAHVLSERKSSQDYQRAHYAGEPPMPTSNPSLTRVPEKPNGRFAPRADTKRRITGRLRSGNRGKNHLSNTQESMVIYTRHPKQKVYTASSKAAVDWDEDLRPSDNEARSPLKDTDITSISSPMPGETSLTGSHLAIPGKRRAAKGRKLATKRKNKSSRPTKKIGNITNKSTAALPLAEDADMTKLILCSSNNRSESIDEEKNGAGATAKCAELYPDNDFVRYDSATPQHEESRTRSPRIQACRKNESFLSHQHQLSTSKMGDNNHQLTSPESHPTPQGLQGRGRAVGNKLSAAFQQGDPSSGTGGHKEHSLEHIKTQNKPRNENGRVLSDILYASVGESGVQGKSEPTESVIERYPIYDKLPLSTPKEQFTGRFEDDIYAEDSVVRHMSRSSSFNVDNEEQKRVSQSAGSAVSSPLCAEEDCSDAEVPYEVCPGSLGAAQNICSSDMHENTSEGIRSPRARSEKRRIAALSSDDMQYDPPTRDQASENAFEEESRRLVHKNHLYPTKRLKVTPRSTIVDSDGSPRLLYRIKSGCIVDWTGVDETYPHVSGTKYRSSTSEHVREILRDGKFGAQDDDLSASWERNVILGSKHSGTCTNREKEVLTFQDRLMACAGKPTSSKTPLRNPARSSPDAHLTLGCDNKPHATCNSLPRATIVPDQLSAQPGLPKSDNIADGVLEHTSWQSSLQALHKRAQGMLLATSEHIIQEIESEKKTINEVLEMYRRDCHRVLDQLFEAQEERIRLCQQQMNSIREHHTEVCQELMQRLERDEKQLQDRMQLRK